LSRDHAAAGRVFNADRFLNRFWDYPRVARRRKTEFDLFHVVDHSYGQLLHELPPERTIITCHDLDTFQCLLNPEQEPRSFLFREMMKRTLRGFRQAARVTCDSVATRDELLTHQLVEPERAVVIPNGVHPSCSPAADLIADREAERLLGPPQAGTPELLHVGSTIPRKRIDVLLRVFAAVRKEFPAARLVRVGGAFTPAQSRLADELDLTEAISVLPHVERNVLAAIYRRAAVLLQPSQREGFGLPVVEALACGTPVVASDLPVLREVGGDAALYCAINNVESWTEKVVQLLLETQRPQEKLGRSIAGVAQASRYSWADYANKMVTVYRELL
jgi:glycosyltransferase involved in cell wall biosynthesis